MLVTLSHQIANWVVNLTETSYASLQHSLKAPFECATKIQKKECISNEQTVSLDVLSLFTNFLVCGTTEGAFHRTDHIKFLATLLKNCYT